MVCYTYSYVRLIEIIGIVSIIVIYKEKFCRIYIYSLILLTMIINEYHLIIKYFQEFPFLIKILLLLSNISSNL